MNGQTQLFADELEFVSKLTEREMTEPTNEDVNRGNVIMRELVADVVANPRPWGALKAYALLHFGYEDMRDEDSCGGSAWFCAMYHQSPSPGSGAFARFLEREGYANLATCPWYRASFSWQVARNARDAYELSEETGYTFSLDEFGAVKAPDDYRPEAPLVVGATRRGAKIAKVHVTRIPSGYSTDFPKWLPTKQKRDPKIECISFLGPVTAWVQYETIPLDATPSLDEDAA